MHNPGPLFWHLVSDTFDAVDFEAKQKKGVGYFTHKAKLSSFFPALIENTPLVSKTVDGLLCVGDRLVHGCTTLSFAPLSINRPCLSHHFDRGGAFSLTVWTQVLLKL